MQSLFELKHNGKTYNALLEALGDIFGMRHSPSMEGHGEYHDKLRTDAIVGSHNTDIIYNKSSTKSKSESVLRYKLDLTGSGWQHSFPSIGYSALDCHGLFNNHVPETCKIFIAIHDRNSDE